MIIEYFVSFAVFISFIANIPQIIKLIKVKDSTGLSLLANCLWIFVTGTMLIYSLTVVKDIYFIISQGSQLLIVSIIVILILKYRNK